MSDTIKFTFKGQRDYVHGTSLFNALTDSAAQRGIEQGRINVSFKQMINNPVCIIEERPAVATDAIIAKIIGSNGEEIMLCINEAEHVESTHREEFDEVEACKGAIVGDKKITQNDPHHTDLIELLVSLCKKMHQECIDSTKKWVFSRYDGTFPIPTPEKVELRVSKQVGTRLTCSDVLVNETQIATIYFS